jgi:pyridoxine kinase
LAVEYLQWKGFQTTAEQVLDLFAGLQLSGLDNFQYLLTGYMPDAKTVAAAGQIGKALKEKDSTLIWGTGATTSLLKWPVLDPVMGDNGALYVSEEVLPMYKSIVPLADVILPNQFEAELLSDLKLDTVEAITPCLRRLHQVYRVRNIVISSIRLDSHPGVILCCGSTSTSTHEPRTFAIEVPLIDGVFVGTGDLFAALFIARLHPVLDKLTAPDPVRASDLVLARILEGAVASMQGVLYRTKRAMDQQLREEGDMKLLAPKDRQAHLMRAAELRLVTSQDALLHPHIDIEAREI